MTRNPVVHKLQPPSKQKFQTVWADSMRDLRRQFPSDTAFAAALGMTTAGVRKIFNGGLTCPKRMFDALHLDETILDHIAALYGKKIVPQEAGEGRAAPTVCALLHEVVEAEADGEITDAEILSMDKDLAAVEKIVGAMRERVRSIKSAQERVAELVA